MESARLALSIFTIPQNQVIIFLEILSGFDPVALHSVSLDVTATLNRYRHVHIKWVVVCMPR